jgi:hypothetical protein
MSETTPETAGAKEAVVDVMPREELLELLLVNEKVGRLEASLGNLQLQIANFKSELDATVEDRKKLTEKINAKYGLNSEDLVDAKTGKITRKK